MVGISDAFADVSKPGCFSSDARKIIRTIKNQLNA